MSKPRLSPQDRAAAKSAWAAFVEAIFEKTHWSEAQLAHRLGCSIPCISRWRDVNPETGRIPSAVARRQLADLARELGIAD